MNKALLIVVLILIVTPVYFLFTQDKDENSTIVTNFEDCIAAGNPAMESYPRQCAHNRVTYVEEIENSQASVENGEIKKGPPIVDHFACSDYCPGPAERYMVKIYEGITDPEECVEIGGEPSTYVGWGEFHICLAEGATLK